MTTEFVGYAPDSLEIPPAPTQLTGVILVIPDLQRCEVGDPVSQVCEIGDIPDELCRTSVTPPDETCREEVTPPDSACRTTDLGIPDEPCRDGVLDIG